MTQINVPASGRLQALENLPSQNLSRMKLGQAAVQVPIVSEHFKQVIERAWRSLDGAHSAAMLSQLCRQGKQTTHPRSSFRYAQAEEETCKQVNTS